MMIYVLDKVENIVGKGENAGYQYSLTDKMLALSNLIAFIEKCQFQSGSNCCFLFYSIESIVGREENAGSQLFLLFHNVSHVFKRLLSNSCYKMALCQKGPTKK